MAQQFDALSERHRAFIERQPMFFVATAARDGRVNVSPKGLDSLRVVDPRRVVWLNGTGSGNETAAHLLDINRMTIMFCSFVREPLILRLYGAAPPPVDTTRMALFFRACGRAPLPRPLSGPPPPPPPGPADGAGGAALSPPLHGARQVHDVEVDLVLTSCGYGVPLMETVGQR